MIAADAKVIRWMEPADGSAEQADRVDTEPQVRLTGAGEDVIDAPVDQLGGLDRGVEVSRGQGPRGEVMPAAAEPVTGPAVWSTLGSYGI